MLEFAINLISYNCRIVIKLDSSEKLMKTEVHVPEMTEKLQRGMQRVCEMCILRKII